MPHLPLPSFITHLIFLSKSLHSSIFLPTTPLYLFRSPLSLSPRVVIYTFIVFDFDQFLWHHSSLPVCKRASCNLFHVSLLPRLSTDLATPQICYINMFSFSSSLINFHASITPLTSLSSSFTFVTFDILHGTHSHSVTSPSCLIPYTTHLPTYTYENISILKMFHI